MSFIREDVKYYILIFLAAHVVYFNSLGGEFVFDDLVAVVKNKDVVLSESIVDIFTHNFWGEDITSPGASHYTYRPITTLSFKLNYLLGKLDPWGYHLVNVILHALVSVFFFILVKNILIGYGSVVHFVAAFLFVLHPIHTESVSSIVGRGDLLAALFFLLGFIYYTKFIKRELSVKYRKLFKIRYLILSLVFAAFSLLSKETGATLICILIIYDFSLLYLNQEKIIKRRLEFYSNKRSFIFRVVLLGFVLILMLGLRLGLPYGSEVVYDKMTNPANHLVDPVSRFLTKSKYNALHMQLLLIPYPLSSDRSSKSIAVVKSFFSQNNLQMVLILFLFMSVFIYFINKKNKVKKQNYIVAFAFMIISFIPSSGWFIDVGFVTAERILYIPSMGYCMIFSMLVSDIYNRLKYNWAKKFVCVMLMVVFVFYANICIDRNRDWSSQKNIFLSILKHYPNNAKAHFNYGLSCRNVQEAARHYKKAIAIEIDYVSPYQELSRLYFSSGKYSQGVGVAKEALAAFNRNPTTAVAKSLWMLYFNLGLAHWNMGEISLAKRSFNQCTKFSYRNVKCLRYLKLIENKLSQ